MLLNILLTLYIIIFLTYAFDIARKYYYIINF